MSKPTEPRLSHGWFRFEDWSAPDPHDEKLGEAMHTARYDLARLTQDQAYAILAAAEAYQHYAGHPADTASILRQLRRLRRAVRKRGAAAIEIGAEAVTVRVDDGEVVDTARAPWWSGGADRT